MHPLIKRAAMSLPAIARLAADRDALLAQCRSVGGERDETRAVLARVTAERDSLRATCDALAKRCDDLVKECAGMAAQLAEAKAVRADAEPFRPVRVSDCIRPAATSRPADVAEHLAGSQMCLLSGAIAPARIAAMRATVEGAITAAGDNYAKILGATGRIDVSVLLAILSSPGLQVVRALFERQYGTADIVLPLAGLMVRRMDPEHRAIAASILPYHQDAFGLPPEFHTVNCWTLASPDECGETAPGLELIPDSVGRFLGQEPNPTSIKYKFLESPHAAVARYMEAYDPWRPVLHLGDVLMFTDLALHRTWMSPAHTRARISVETRLIACTGTVRDYISRDGMPVYTITGETLSGPAAVRRDEAGRPVVLEHGSWRIG